MPSSPSQASPIVSLRPALALGVVALLLARPAQPQNAVWTATQTSATLRDSVAGIDDRYLKAQPDSVIVEIRGVFTSTSTEPIRLPNISLLISFTDAQGLTVSRPSTLFGVGLVAPKGYCAYEFPHQFVPRANRMLMDPEGNGYDIQKGAEAVPAVLRLLRNPSRLCLAFGAPAVRLSALTLRLGSSEITVVVPSAR